MKKSTISRLRDVSIKIKILGPMYLIMMIGTVVFGVSILFHLRTVSFAQTKSTANDLAVLLSKDISVGFDVNDIFGLSRIVDEYQKTDADLKDIGIVNKSYLVTGATNNDLIGQKLKTKEIVLAIQEGKKTIKLSEDSAGEVVEVVVPVFPGTETKKVVGAVRMLYSLSHIYTFIFDTVKRMIFFILILAPPIFMITIFVINIAITEPVKRIIQSANKIINERDLIQKIEIKNYDEIGELAVIFNKTVKSLRDLIDRIKRGADLLNESSVQILASSEQQANGAIKQAASITEATSTIEELAIASRRISEDSGKVVRVAESTLESVRNGQNTTRDAIGSVFKIKEEAELNAQKILVLGRKSQQIGSVLEIITDVADQTNMLALNAAIEAARAGEFGKGFGVVAEEVRKLAEHVVESARQIERIISEIQAMTNVAVMSTEKNVKSAEEGAELSRKIEDELQKILNMIEQTTESAESISITTRQQQSANDQTVSAMREISSIAQQSAAMSSQAISSTEELSRFAKELEEMVGSYKI
ncbi:MAG: hypothetical protein HY776_03585 [Actinobacteria bacterium]|nr:hypothetical protein [Actinomycetota bacterium]